MSVEGEHAGEALHGNEGCRQQYGAAGDETGRRHIVEMQKHRRCDTGVIDARHKGCEPHYLYAPKEFGRFRQPARSVRAERANSLRSYRTVVYA